MSGSFIRFVASFLRHGAARDKEFLFKRKAYATGIVTFLLTLVQRNPLAQRLVTVGSHFKRSRCRSRIVLLCCLVLGALFLWTMFGSPFKNCVRYTPVYLRQTLDEQYRVIFPKSVQVTNSCPFCHELKLNLPCYKAKLLCDYDPAFEDNKRQFMCDCNCGAFESPEPSLSKDRGAKKVNILFFTSHELVLRATSQHELLYYEAAQALPDFSAHMFGPGFEGYNSELSVKENVANAFPNMNFDVLFIQIPSNYHFTDSIYTNIQELSKDLLVVLRLHECRYGLCEDHLTRTAAHIAMFAYARDLINYGHHSDKLLVHVPHVVHPPRYNNYSVGSPSRVIDVVLAGGYGPDYPFGRRLYNLIQEGVIQGAKVLPHPPPHSDIHPEVQYRIYTNNLESAKVALVTSSVDRLMLMKYGEVAMSGALIAGEIPLGHHAELRTGMIELTDDMSDQEIVKVIRHYVTSVSEREAKVLQARKLFLTQYTTWKFFSKLQDVTTLYRHGGRGLIYPQFFVSEELLERPSCTEFYLGHILFDFRVVRHWFSRLFV